MPGGSSPHGGRPVAGWRIEQFHIFFDHPSGAEPRGYRSNCVFDDLDPATRDAVPVPHIIEWNNVLLEDIVELICIVGVLRLPVR